MSELIAVAFQEQEKAQDVLTKLQRLRKEHLIELDDAVVVIRDGEGNVKLNQTHNLVAAGALGGSFWGGLVGLLFLNPLIGLAAGAASGALAGHFADIGIDDDFMKEVGQTLEKESSAIFILVRKVTGDKVLAEFEGVGGRVIKTSLSDEDERKLQDALAKQREAHGGLALESTQAA